MATTPQTSTVDLLRVWLEEAYGSPVRVVGEPAVRDEGFDSEIHLAQFAGESLPDQWTAPLVLRVKDAPDRQAEAEREVRVHGWLQEVGYPAPAILRLFAPGELVDRPVQVMERAPGELVVDVLRRRPWSARSLVQTLARVHVQLHQLPVDGFPVGDDLLDRRLSLVRRTAAALDHEGLRRGLDRAELLATQLRDAPPAVCHGDFHPLNVLVDGSRPTVIDWTDAGVGDRHGDVARTLTLFQVASIAAESPMERRLLRLVGPPLGRGYARAYRRGADFDERRIALWRPIHLLHGWSQVIGVHSGLFGAGDDRLPPGLSEELERRCDRCFSAVDV